MTAKSHWEHFEHGADIGVRGVAPTKEGAFEQAALALTAAVVDPEEVRKVDPVQLACEAPDDELLLVDWLNALVYEMSVRGMLFARFEVHLDGTSLRATAWGEPIEPSRHAPTVEVKGATYTELSLAQTADGDWIAQCVVDV
jgi:tRNA nucleotidyltransferase (CCA-adding enzyme)